MRWCREIIETISRQKPWDVRSLHQTQLSRSLNVVELIGIGIGSCAGLGIYVMSAHVARNEAGPGVVLSVLVASLAALLSGLCHIELATRLPRSGTGYVFCYVTLGELLAFVIGWSLILENVINGAVAAKAMWQYLEYMYNYTEDSNTTETSYTSQIAVFESTPDFFPCLVVIAVIVISFITVKRYAIVNFVLISLSGLVVLAFICVGFFHVDANNWNSSPGFFVHGLGGVMSGAGLMMSSFISVDNLASCAEESRTPCKSLPTAFGFSLAVLFSLFFLVTSALTLATPWQTLADSASLARAYETKGIFAANYVVGAGAVIGLLPVVIGSFFHPVRVMYSMSGDNLLPKCFSRIGYNGLPIIPHYITGLLVALCALLVNVRTLLEMSSIATIIQFITSAIITLFIRYQPLPVGICKEYSDIELASSTCEDDQESKDTYEINRPKLVLLSNGECKLSKEGEHLFSSIPETLPITNSKISAFPKTKPNIYPTLVEGSSPTFAAAAPIRFTNRFKKLNTIATKEMYNEKDSLRSGVAVNYGMAVGVENVVRGGSNEILTDSSKTVNAAVLTVSTNINSVNSSVSSSLVALSPGCQQHADERTWRHTRYFLLTYILSSTCLATVSQVWPSELADTWWAVTLLCGCVVLMIACALCIARQPQNSTPLYFKTPYVPVVPLLAVSCNMLLLASLPMITWTRFSIWLLPGIVLYTCYSQRRSFHKQQDDQDVVLFDISQLQSSTE